jgi:uncharacterized membrane protein YkoI
MNTPTDAQQPQSPKARRFTGRKRTLVIAGAAGALILGGGTAAAFAADLDDDRSELIGNDTGDRYDHGGADDVNEMNEQYDDDFGLPDDAIGEDAAVEAALAEVPGEVHDVDLEGTPEAPLWIVEVIDADGVEWDVTVDALDGEVTEVLLDDDADDTDDDDGQDDEAGDTDDADDQDDNNGDDD